MQREMFDWQIAKQNEAGIHCLREGVRLDRFDNPPMAVRAIRYAKGLIIHTSFENKPRGYKTDYLWTVAHEPTGFSIVLDVPKRKARIVAGILSELPIDWSATTQEDFFKTFKALPQTLQQFVHEIRKADWTAKAA